MSNVETSKTEGYFGNIFMKKNYLSIDDNSKSNHVGKVFFSSSPSKSDLIRAAKKRMSVGFFLRISSNLPLSTREIILPVKLIPEAQKKYHVRESVATW